MNFVSRTVLTVTGEVRLPRAYYYCDCGKGFYPWDQQLGLDGHFSPAAQALIALAGALVPFRTAAEDLLRRLSGMRVSAASCRSLTEAAGERLGQQHQAAVPVRPAHALAPWDLTIPDVAAASTPETVAYVGLDAFAVPCRAVGGSGVEYRMLTVGLLYSPDKKLTLYFADFDRQAVARSLRCYACAWNLGRADAVVALTDGGQGIESLLRACVSDKLEFILDFWHAAEHLHEFGRVWHGRDSPEARAWSEQAKGWMRQEGGSGLLKRLRGLDLPGDAAEELREEYRRLLGYVESNVHRMDYPCYRSRGWDIGSGPTEAGCKVIGSRLKGAGMRWLEAGSEQVGGLRALYLSGEGLWDAFWASRSLPTA